MTSRITAVAVLITGAALAQQPPSDRRPIAVSPNIQVTRGDADRPHYEVQLCADPADATRLLIGVMAGIPNNRYVTEIYASADAGRAWQRGFEETPALSSFDPACAYGIGEGFFVTIGFPSDDARTDTAVLKSTDHGRSWQRLAGAFPRSVDRPYLTVDRSAAPHGHLYVHGKRDRRTLDLQTEYLEHLWIARSSDGGATFTHLDVPSLAKQINPGNAVVLADGTFAAVFAEIHDTSDPSKNAIKFVRSTTRAASVGAPVKVAGWNVPRETNSTRLPVLAGSGRSLYAAWPDGTEIMFSASHDAGATWTAPVALVAMDGGHGGFNPAIAVNGEGVIGVLWYDKRDHPSDLGWGVRFAASLDGKTFLPSVRVAEKDVTPGSGLGQRGRMSAAGGDTSGLDAGADGAFHAAWIDNRSGIPQVWSSRILVRRDSGGSTVER